MHQSYQLRWLNLTDTEIRATPNPAYDELRVEMEGFSTQTLRLFNYWTLSDVRSTPRNLSGPVKLSLSRVRFQNLLSAQDHYEGKGDCRRIIRQRGIRRARPAPNALSASQPGNKIKGYDRFPVFQPKPVCKQLKYRSSEIPIWSDFIKYL